MLRNGCNEPNNRVEEIWQEIAELTINEKAKLAEKLLSIPELSVVLNDNRLESDILVQIEKMSQEQLGKIVHTIGKLVLSKVE